MLSGTTKGRILRKVTEKGEQKAKKNTRWKDKKKNPCKEEGKEKKLEWCTCKKDLMYWLKIRKQNWTLEDLHKFQENGIVRCVL